MDSLYIATPQNSIFLINAKVPFIDAALSVFFRIIVYIRYIR